MSKSDSIIVASYRNPEDADAVISELRRTELSDKQIGLMMRDDDARTRFKSLKELDGDGDHKAGAAAAAGAAAGAGSGALWALGIAAGVLPAIGPVVAGGILGAMIASAGTGAVAGGVIGSLIGLGMSDEDAKFAATEVESGATVVVIKNPQDRLAVVDILERRTLTFSPSMRTRNGLRSDTTDHRPYV